MSWDVSERFTIRSLVFTRVLVILVNFFHIPLRTRGRSGGWGEGRIRVLNDRSAGNNERSKSCGGEVRGEMTGTVGAQGVTAEGLSTEGEKTVVGTVGFGRVGVEVELKEARADLKI